MSVKKIDEMIGLLQLAPGSRVLDIGCGKGEFLIRLAEAVDINGTGVDISPYAIAEARERTKARLPNARIEYVESDGKVFYDQFSEKVDLAVCMGATWIFKNHENTLKSLASITKKHGIIIVGEPFWVKQPTQWFLEISNLENNEYTTHAQNIEIGEKLGLRPMHAIVSNLDDWDTYEGLSWLGADHHVVNNPDDPDNQELLKNVTKYRKAYIREGRDVFSWALYLFRKLD